MAHVDAEPARLDPDVLADLPDPARRFLGTAISPGTPLRTVAELSMHGDFSLGTKDKPDYQPMCACQLLAAPHGFIWQVSKLEMGNHFGTADYYPFFRSTIDCIGYLEHPGSLRECASP